MPESDPLEEVVVYAPIHPENQRKFLSFNRRQILEKYASITASLSSQEGNPLVFVYERGSQEEKEALGLLPFILPYNTTKTRSDSTADLEGKLFLFKYESNSQNQEIRKNVVVNKELRNRAIALAKEKKIKLRCLPREMIPLRMLYEIISVVETTLLPGNVLKYVLKTRKAFLEEALLLYFRSDIAPLK